MSDNGRARVPTGRADADITDGFPTIKNPFGLALERGIDLNAQLRQNPEKGSQLLDQLTAEVAHQIETALANGAGGITYTLHGAAPTWCTPMQYGGYYLERDRELLQEAPHVILCIIEDDEGYYDFVNDLPANEFTRSILRGK